MLSLWRGRNRLWESCFSCQGRVLLRQSVLKRLSTRDWAAGIDRITSASELFGDFDIRVGRLDKSRSTSFGLYGCSFFAYTRLDIRHWPLRTFWVERAPR